MSSADDSLSFIYWFSSIRTSSLDQGWLFSPVKLCTSVVRIRDIYSLRGVFKWLVQQDLNWVRANLVQDTSAHLRLGYPKRNQKSNKSHNKKPTKCLWSEWKTRHMVLWCLIPFLLSLVKKKNHFRDPKGSLHCSIHIKGVSWNPVIYI